LRRIRIEKLNPDVSARIAAGEVIESPASIVKELIENSLDAGATAIKVVLNQGGKSKIVVEDDGFGILFNDLPLAVERFATSKISDVDDLCRIGTFGFRGEALGSIAAVSRLEIRSKAREEQEGGLLICTAGKVELHRRINTFPGTRVQVEDLFFNFPARRKFLKSSQGETRRVSSVVRDYGVAFPDKVFTLISEGRVIFSTDGNIEGRTSLDILNKIWPSHCPIQRGRVDLDSVKITAFWQPLREGTRVNLTVFVNGRRVQDSVVRAAISSFGQPASGLWFVILDVPTEDLDVNIHPAKAEVRFRNSGEIYKAAGKLIEEMLMRSKQVFSIPLSNPFIVDKNGLAEKADDGEKEQKWERNFVENPEGRGSERELYVDSRESFLQFIDEDKQHVRFLGRLSSGYLLYESSTNFVLLDPHASHERILFEFFLGSIRDGSRQNIYPELELPPSISEAAREWINILEEWGFSFKEQEGVLHLTGVPAGVSEKNLSPIGVLRLALDAAEKTAGEDLAEAFAEGLASEACKNAMKITKIIEEKEALALWKELFACKSPQACPHGRPTHVVVTVEDMERLFRRK